MAPDKLFLMVDEAHRFGELLIGPTAAAATESHYASLDAWCGPPQDSGSSEEFLAVVYAIPRELEAEVRAFFDELTAVDASSQAIAFIKEHPELTRLEVNVAYTAGERAKASLMPSLPDLLRRRGES